MIFIFSKVVKCSLLDELFARIDSDNDQAVNLDDYMKRDRYYVESVKNEFSDIDVNGDSFNHHYNKYFKLFFFFWHFTN